MLGIWIGLFCVVASWTCYGQFFDLSGSFTLRAEGTLEWHQKQKKLYIARDQVVLQNDSFRLQGDVLRVYLDASEQISRIVVEGHLVLEQDVYKIAGDKGVYDREKEVLVITGQALTLTDGETLVTATESFTFYNKEQRFLAQGSTHTKHKQMVLQADRLEGQVQGDTLDRLDAYGSIYLKTQDTSVRCQRMTYDVDSGYVVLTEDVRLIRGQNTINAPYAEIDFQTQMIRMKSTSQQRIQGKFMMPSFPDIL